MASRRANGLWTRLVVGLLLILLALTCLWAGGLVFAALVTLGGLLIFAEWAVMHRLGRAWRLAGLLLVALGCTFCMFGQPFYALLLLAAAALMARLVGRSANLKPLTWLAGGILYAGLPAVALIWMRDADNGLATVLWILAIVWATDIFAYFAGRYIGGPKLAPKISPNKTWAGLGGGTLGAAATSGALGVAFQLPLPPFAAIPAAAGLAILAQAGDLYESWLKRRAGLKDSGALLPGHGGVMDRLDGLVPVAIVVGLLLALRGGAS